MIDLLGELKPTFSKSRKIVEPVRPEPCPAGPASLAACFYPHNSALASLAPFASASSLAHMMLGCTRR
jgi:hypothetical protein